MKINYLDSDQSLFRPQIRRTETVQPFRFFQAVGGGGYDRFGNKIFSSLDLAFLEKSEELKEQRNLAASEKAYNETQRTGKYVEPVTEELKGTAAAILVSREGQKLIKKHPGLLKAVDQAVKQMKSNNDSALEINLGRETARLEPTGHEGAQSILYLLSIGEEKYMIKTITAERNTVGDEELDVGQPYINEMLQAQAVQTDLASDLEKNQVRLPTYLFASNNVCCVEFSVGEKPTTEEIKPVISSLAPTLKTYIETQERTSELWSGLLPDFINLIYQEIKVDNFIKTPSGKFVLIDPFLHSANADVVKRLREINKNIDKYIS
ncbi:MAG: hypothetical protein AAB966_03525 [Patescibacteria group bacterium]